MDYKQTFNNSTVFKKATYEDINKIVQNNFEFNDYYKEISGIEYDSENLINKTYVMEKDGRTIGMVRLENNAESISLQVVTENKNALNLYKSCGFTN